MLTTSIVAFMLAILNTKYLIHFVSIMKAIMKFYDTNEQARYFSSVRNIAFVTCSDEGKLLNNSFRMFTYVNV
jgi:hypothetical protein